MIAVQNLNDIYNTIFPALGRYPPTMVQTYTADEGDFLMIPCMEVKSVPDATYSWGLAETEDDESPQSLDLSERLVINPKGISHYLLPNYVSIE